jgi:2-polyprenyl-3-methyl-5-hydroxy-6-metoxy-1,4-benzoquinol methylase
MRWPLLPNTPQYYDRVFQHDVIGNPRALGWIENHLKHVRPELSGSILDLGCGLGLLASSAKDVYLGVDFSQVAIEYAASHHSNGEFIKADILDFVSDVDDDGFDTVVLAEVLEHFHEDDRSTLLSEAKRIANCKVVVTLPMDSPDPTHVKPQWKREEVEQLVGPVEVRDIRGHWLAIWDKQGRSSKLGDNR